MAPVRTGLDERVLFVGQRIEEFGKLGRKTYELAMETLEGHDRMGEIQRNRNRARKLMSELSDDLLLILTLNQPLSKDLRIIAGYMRAIDVLERTVRHARKRGPKRRTSYLPPGQLGLHLGSRRPHAATRWPWATPVTSFCLTWPH